MGKEKTGSAVNALIQKRNTSLVNYFAQKQIPANRVIISAAKQGNDVSRGQSPKYMINMATQD
jgi:hypothetical protein